MNLSSTLRLTALSLCLATSVAQASPTNFALSQPATASGLYSGGGNYSIENGNDGNTGSLWNGGAHAAFWQVDLQTVRSIDQIAVYGADGPGYHITFQLSSSLDGITWDLIGPLTTGSGAAWSFLFQTGGAAMRYINYSTLGDGGSDWALLGDLQAIGEGGTGNGSVPLPTTLGLTLLGVAGLGWRRARQASR